MYFDNSYNKIQRDALFLKIYFDKVLYMFRTDLLFIIRSLNTVYTTIGICHAVMLTVCQRGQDSDLVSGRPVYRTATNTE